MPPNSFKTDESFLEKLAIGAAGTRQVMSHMRNHGLDPIELERGSTGYKIWKSIKIKRVRVPDILCIRTGIRVESRAKTKMTISMSHSKNDEIRGWDYGLRDDDFVALVACKKSGDEPIDWDAQSMVQYIKVDGLRQAYNNKLVIDEKAKGSQEGNELRLTWPAAIASAQGTIITIDDRLRFRRTNDNYLISLSLKSRGILMTPTVSTGEVIQENQILASVVPILRTLPNTQISAFDYFKNLLSSHSIADRYAAAKAFSSLDMIPEADLVERISDSAEHIYVKLECAACLARRDISLGSEFIKTSLQSEYLPHRLESVIILGEIKSGDSAATLMAVLNDSSQHEEIRSGAAWAIGELNRKETIPALITAFNNIEFSIRVEAARSLYRMCSSFVDQIEYEFSRSTDYERQGIAWALSQSKNWNLSSLLSSISSDSEDARKWLAYIIGKADQRKIADQVEVIRESDPQLYFAVTVFWKIASSWINDLKPY